MDRSFESIAGLSNEHHKEDTHIMSRIYEALKQSDKPIGCSIAELIDGDQIVVADDSEKVAITECVKSVPKPESRPADAGDHQIEGYRVVPLCVPARVPIIAFDGSVDRAAEQYRILRTNILQHPKQPTMIAISSADPGDGKTITAINTAAILAMKSDNRVLLIDADLRQCSVAPAMGIEASPGLVGVLSGECRLEEAIVRIEQLPNLHVLPSGPLCANPVELLDSAFCNSTIQRLRDRFDIIVVDTTPTAAVADFKLVLQLCDGVLLVIRPDHTKRDSFLRALQIEPQEKLLGTVLNGSEEWFLWKGQEHDLHYYAAKGYKGGSGAGVRRQSPGNRK